MLKLVYEFVVPIFDITPSRYSYRTCLDVEVVANYLQCCVRFNYPWI